VSALAGVVYFDGPGPAQQQVQRMTAHMQDRGPDGITHWSAPGVALGFCRLCTTPESLAEQQPLLDEHESFVLVFAGRVDNRRALRSTLIGAGCQLRDDSDAELVLKSWILWGEHCPEQIIGDFAFVIWDIHVCRLFGARDAAGNRSLYFASGQGWFAFASEARALIASGLVDDTLNQLTLLDFISVENDRIDENATFWQDICKLPLGHSINVTAGAVQKTRYWFPEQLAPLQFSSLAECEQAFRECLTEAIRCRLRSIGPVGAFLSGGLDSSSIVALVSRKLSDALPQSLLTYSLCGDLPEESRDLPFIKVMQQMPHIESRLLPARRPASTYQQLMASLPDMATPCELADTLPEMIVADAAMADGCRVLLDGMGGDMLFITPEHSLDFVFRERRFDLLPAVIRAHYRHEVRGVWRNLLKKSLRPLIPSALLQQHRDRLDQARDESALKAGQRYQFLAPALAKEYLASRKTIRRQQENIRNSRPGKPPQHLWMLSPMYSYYYEMTDAMMGRHHIEQRGPFSDRRLMEFAICMPVEASLANGWFKSSLRQSMAGILPEQVRLRTSLHGHPGGSFYRHLANANDSEIQHLLELALRDPDYTRLVNVGNLAGFAAQNAANSSIANDYEIFRLVVLGIWLHNQEYFK
jgi:asparagine synthase (glutamine-hydrolysing)